MTCLHGRAAPGSYHCSRPGLCSISRGPNSSQPSRQNQDSGKGAYPQYRFHIHKMNLLPASHRWSQQLCRARQYAPRGTSPRFRRDLVCSLRAACRATIPTSVGQGRWVFRSRDHLPVPDIPNDDHVLESPVDLDLWTRSSGSQAPQRCCKRAGSKGDHCQPSILATYYVPALRRAQG